MKVTVKKKTPANEIPVVISTEFIKLQDAMKFANIVYSGGEAKQLILDEQVLVNGEIPPGYQSAVFERNLDIVTILEK